MNNEHVIIGSGPTGQATARLLVSRGEQVVIINRSGSGDSIAGVQRLACDAANKDSLRSATGGATVIYNCANPSYTSWPTDWPPLADSILNAATHAGARLVTLSNLYGYAPPTRPMVETDPLTATSVKGRVRADMWLAAKAAHDAGDVEVTEARASDFFGAALGPSVHMGDRVTSALKAGKTVDVLGDPDAPHSWTAIDDVATTLVELGSNPAAAGLAWHVPTAAPLSQRELITQMGHVAGLENVKIRKTPPALLKVLGWCQPVIRELEEVMYQFEQPFVLDSSAAIEQFNLKPAPLAESLAKTMGHDAVMH